jgi:hypothetical protein
MVHARGLGRLGTLAVGLGIGAAMAHSPVAAADSSTDWLASVDSLLGGLSAPAEASSGLDIQISIDGTDLFSATDNSATATSGQGDIAIAIGDGASANANGGSGDFAFADGSGALASAGGLSADTGANDDTAIDIGTNSTGNSLPDGAFAGNDDLIGNNTGGTGSGDTAIDIGNNTADPSIAGPMPDSGHDGAFAGAGGLALANGNGNDNTAIDIGNNAGINEGADAFDGDGNYASESGNTTGDAEEVEAGNGDDNIAISDTSYSANSSGVVAGDGNGNYGYVDGPENSGAEALEGDHDIAYVLDPFGSTASVATSGLGGNDDLAAALFADGFPNATGADSMYDIITALGNETGTAASTGGSFLSELLSLF